MTTEIREKASIADLNVNDVVRLWPNTVTVFARHDIDSCCGGAIPVAEAARKHGVPLGDLLEEIRAAAGD